MIAGQWVGPAEPMAEVQWLGATEPRAMLRYCENLMSDRQKRLYLVGCCQSVWGLFKNETSRQAVLVAERFVDGLASPEELQRSHEDARGVSDPAWYWIYRNPHAPQLESVRRVASAHTGAVNATAAVWAFNAGPNIAFALGGMDSPACIAEMRRQATILRCILINPFRPVTPDPSWLSSTVLALAEGIYADRAFDRMPILADALQDAGCDNPHVLDHCRAEGPHVRGCWVVDLLTGRT